MMQSRRIACALLLSSLAFSINAANAQTEPPQAPAQQAATINPDSVPRGRSFAITVSDAPIGAKNVIVAIGPQFIRATPGRDRNTYDVTLPDPFSTCNQQASGTCTGDQSAFIPLGEYTISISFDEHWFPVAQKLKVIKADQQRPILREVQPEQIIHTPGKGSLRILGSHFVVHPAQDNSLFAGGQPVVVLWDGCPEHPDASTTRTPGFHGEVKSPNEIALCGLTLPSKIDTDVMIRQGELDSNIVTLRVVPWPDGAVIWFSFGIALAAIGLVVFLASFLPAYRIHKTTYGMFTILFLDSETNTYSLSKYQFYLWTLAALFAYSYYALSQVLIQSLSLPDVPNSLPGIIAIGAGTAIGAQVVTTVRGPKGGGQELPSLGDFVTSGGVAAPERVQMFVWTNLGVLAFCLATLHDPPWHISHLPIIGDGLMYLMGISSAGYLGGKLARKPGPMLTEVSITPSSFAATPLAANVTAPQPNIDRSQPIAAAQQLSRDIQTAITPVAATTSTIAFTAMQSALQALRTGIAAAQAGGPNVLATLADTASAADAGSQAAAAEFAKVLSTSQDDADPHLADLRILAEQAQRAAAAAQDLASGVSQATSIVQATAAAQAGSASPAPAMMTIDLRGRNLSITGTFDVNGDNLPFAMLANDGGTKAPKMVAAEADGNQATMAREVRLSIDPAALSAAEKIVYNRWFSAEASSFKIGITNPDGQRSEMTVAIPPGSQQSHES